MAENIQWRLWSFKFISFHDWRAGTGLAGTGKYGIDISVYSKLMAVCWLSYADYVWGIKSISPDINEAARIDGASKTQIAFKITIPLLKPVLQVCTTFSLIGALKIFDLIYVLTGGGPFFSTEVPTIYMYKTIFDSFKYGYGSAIAIFVIIECLILTCILRTLFRDKEKA